MLAAAAIASACATDEALVPADRVTVTGMLGFADDGQPWLEDCRTQQRVDVGTMTTGNYLYLRRRAEALGARDGKRVTAQISGYLRSTAAAPRLHEPALMWLSPGHCAEGADEPPVERPQRRRGA